MRNRDYVWRTANGREIRLEDMDIDHLINLSCWLYRQRETIEAMQIETGLDFPRRSFQGSTIDTWLERTQKELMRRRNNEIKEAQKLI